MAIVKQHDKRSGLTYAYESEYYWDKEKKQSRCKRKLIGRVDPKTGEIVPTDGRCRKDKKKVEEAVKKEEPKVERRHLYYGATYLLDNLSEKLGLVNDLRECFPDIYKQILSIAYYMILEDNTPLYRFEKFNATHKHPYGKNITSPRSSDLFARITDEQINKFFSLQGKRRVEEEYWAYDSTSISSYSEMLKQVQYGKNKEDDKLPQLNLLLVFGEKSGIPFYYRKLAGNIPDSKTVKHLLHELDILGFNKTKFVMDRGFYSEKNITDMLNQHVKFLVGVKTSLSFIKENLNNVYDKIRDFQNYDEAANSYGYTVTTSWNPDKTNSKNKHKINIHLYYSIDKGAEEESAFDKRIAGLYRELIENKRVDSHEKSYSEFFEIKKTPKKIQVIPKEQAIKNAKKYLGYFALVSNEKMDAFTALHIYRMKDVVEKGFGNLKEKLNLRRMLVSSERSLDGKIFVEFIALILTSYLSKKMKDADLYKSYSFQQLLDKLDVMECFIQFDNTLKFAELLNKQKDIYNALNIPIPSSL